MLGIRLDAETEKRLARHARATGRAKSVIARDWIVERLERESIDEEMRRAAEALSNSLTTQEQAWSDAATSEWLHLLDEEDGGYDWGPKGPPA